MTTLTTPFLEQHRKAGAKLVEFAGFLMPVSYAGILQEHRAVRQKAGVFDVWVIDAGQLLTGPVVASQPAPAPATVA